ncbi:MAG: hypothetical protein MRY79_03555 [Alphaproteobacteria bacterium]|nr:hypothetical protein [Alphaproteobacteria bacterium]
MKNSLEKVGLLSSISEEFSRNVIRNFEGDALAKYKKSATFFEMAKVIWRNIRFQQSRRVGFNPETRLKRLARYNQAALPILRRAFGEQALIEALPEKAKTEEIVSLCKKLEAPEIASLCRKGISYDRYNARTKTI